MDKIQNYRQPIVTATCIILGFTLNFSSIWVTDAFSKHWLKVIIVCISLSLCITTLMVVLYRILNINYPKDEAEEYYKKTLLLFMIGVSTPFVTIFIILIVSLLIDAH